MAVMVPPWASAMPSRTAARRSPANTVRMNTSSTALVNVGVEGELIAQREGQRQHPLAHGHPGDDAIHQLGGEFAHPAAPARGAEAPALATAGHDHLIAAPLALDVHAAVLEPATAQIGAQFPGDEGGEPVAAALVGSAGQEGLDTALEGAVEDGVLGPMALITRGADQGHEPGPGAAAMPGRSGGGGAEKSRAW